MIEQTGEQQEKIDTHHDVEAAKELDSLVDRGLDISLLAHCARLECRGLDVGEALLDQRERLPRCVQVDVNEEHVCVVLCEQARRLKADAAVHRKVD